MSTFLTLLFPALIPALTDGVRGLFAHFTGSAGAQPQNVAEQIKLWEAQTARLAALADLDRPAANVSPWVSDVRAIFRYAAVATIILSTIAAIFLGADTASKLILLDMTGASMSFIIGERMYLGIRT